MALNTGTFDTLIDLETSFASIDPEYQHLLRTLTDQAIRSLHRIRVRLSSTR